MMTQNRTKQTTEYREFIQNEGYYKYRARTKLDKNYI